VDYGTICSDNNKVLLGFNVHVIYNITKKKKKKKHQNQPRTGIMEVSALRLAYSAREMASSYVYIQLKKFYFNFCCIVI
jgi:hypothetical protein